MIVIQILLSSSALATVLYIVSFIRRKRCSPQFVEPPKIQSRFSIPWIEPLLGIMRFRMQYFVQTSVRFRTPVATIQLPSIPIYLVSSTKFISSIQRQPEVLSARFFFGQAIPRMVGANKESIQAFANVTGGVKSDESLLLEGIRATKRILNSKGGSDMNFDAATIVSANFEHIQSQDFSMPIDLWEWVKRQVVLAVSESTYGKNNPFWDEQTSNAFWLFADDSIWLAFTSFLPKWAVRNLLKGHDAREILVKEIQKYFRDSSHKKGSHIVQTHYNIFSRYIDQEEIARFECANAMGSFANTAPATFWTIYHIFSDPAALSMIRKQVEAITVTSIDGEGNSTREISVKRLREETTLFSALEETSRLRTSGLGVRMVLADTVITDGQSSHVLKKGGILAIANKALHTDKRIWGEDADIWKPTRFQQKENLPPSAFRGFGEGTNACCGKRFALHQISSFVAMLVARYDILPVGGEWIDPTQDGRDTTSQVAAPVNRMMVRLIPREMDSQASWKFVE